MTTIMAIIARVVHFIPKWWTLHLVYHLYSLHIWISIRSTSDAFFFPAECFFSLKTFIIDYNARWEMWWMLNVFNEWEIENIRCKSMKLSLSLPNVLSHVMCFTKQCVPHSCLIYELSILKSFACNQFTSFHR